MQGPHRTWAGRQWRRLRRGHRVGVDAADVVEDVVVVRREEVGLPAIIPLRPGVHEQRAGHRPAQAEALALGHEHHLTPVAI